MRAIEELIKEVTEEINGGSEYAAKAMIKQCIQEITQQRNYIKQAEEKIKKLQLALKEITINELPADLLTR